MPEWSKQIKAFRHRRQWTQEQLARRLGIVKKIVADWEQGRQAPSPRRYVQLAKLAPRDQALWFLGQVGLEGGFLEQLMADAGGIMAEKRTTVRVEELALSNSLQLTALVELLEERGILAQGDVLDRMRQVRDRKGS